MIVVCSRFVSGREFRVCVRTMFRLPLWMEWLKISPAGAELLLAQGVPGYPIHAGFAWVGVVEPWVEWETDLSPFRDDTVLTHTLQSCR